MKFRTHNVDGYKVVVVEKFFTEVELQDIVKELEFLNHPTKLFPPMEIDKVEGTIIKHCFENTIDSFYRADSRHVSNILKHNHKLWNETVTVPLQKISDFYRFVKDCNNDITLVSYYEDKCYYKPHLDKSVVTTITPYYKTPKVFEGGNIIINGKLELELINNHMIIIPSTLSWEITRVSIPSDYIELGYGLYTVRQHLGIVV